MMTQSISKFPLSAGQSILNATKTISGWSFAQFMTAPLQNLGLGVLGLAMVFSASNALFWQTSPHPSPLFASPSQSAMNVQNSSQAIQPPHPLEMAVSRAVAQSQAQGQSQVQSLAAPVVGGATVAGASVANDKVTNEMLANAQTVLTDLGMFDGKVDGYYGPQTAQAIRAFETRFGLTPKGALTPQIINKINTTKPGDLPAPLAQAVPAAPSPIAAVQVEPVSVAVKNEAPIHKAQDILTTLSNSAAQASLANAPQVVAPIEAPVNPQVDKELIANIQKGLSNLGFYNKSLDGIAGESTAKAIREFENFLSFEMTGRVSPQVQQWLVDAGAYL